VSADRAAARYFRRLRGRRRATDDGRLVTFGGRLAVLREVAVDFARCAGRAGGEPLGERQRPGVEVEQRPGPRASRLVDEVRRCAAAAR
jgi:hypothetical protein